MSDDLSSTESARITLRCVGCQEPASLTADPDYPQHGLGDTWIGKARDGTVLYRCPECFPGLWITGGGDR